MSVPTTVGGSVTPLASAFGYGVAVDAENVYWTDSYNCLVLKMSTTVGGPPTTLASGQYQDSPYGIAVDSTNVYWAIPWVAAAATGVVMKVSINGGDASTVASGQQNVKYVAVDSKSVYWLLGNLVMKMSTTVGGPPTTLISAETSVGGMALDSTSIYWLGYDTVMKLTPK
jgi:hypothetical protein